MRAPLRGRRAGEGAESSGMSAGVRPHGKAGREIPIRTGTREESAREADDVSPCVVSSSISHSTVATRSFTVSLSPAHRHRRTGHRGAGPGGALARPGASSDASSVGIVLGQYANVLGFTSTVPILEYYTAVH